MSIKTKNLIMYGGLKPEYESRQRRYVGIPRTSTIITKRHCDGVYVDVSFRNNEMTLGFAVVRSGKAYLYSLPSGHNQTTGAEREAIRLAQQLYPGDLIFCDCLVACEKEGATWILRQENHLAHKAARHRINWLPIMEKNAQC